MKKILAVFGTRPEAIKMCPVILELKKRGSFCVKVAVSGQHREMLREVLDLFGITPDYDMNIMKVGQSLSDITLLVMRGMEGILDETLPDIVLVHGDTSTAYAAALSAFFRRIPVGHIEAGLRTYDTAAPFPEEFNRRAIALIASLHFAPTEAAKRNLLSEGCRNIYVTGNTVIDALLATTSEKRELPLPPPLIGKPIVLLTVHRRESLGEPMRRVLCAVGEIAKKYPDTAVVYPVHKNPDIVAMANSVLSHIPNVFLSKPIGVLDFHNILASSVLVLTDSGGVQEEACALGIRTLVLRETTEREEALRECGARLVGTS
ncbi:MAG: UDP-N-acetylglucosamine 2-epimerase (non-hydrolyzing), partial [Clostridia bacterium]|nr:UDP-N-acetylglucosamine 2-epimerase (non-hydrolyzing) [Clostridia bacterium]